MKYLIIYEKTATGYSAYVPDLPGCIAGGFTFEETAELMRGAIQMHLEAMREDGDPIPEPTTRADYIEAPAACVTTPGSSVQAGRRGDPARTSHETVAGVEAGHLPTAAPRPSGAASSRRTVNQLPHSYILASDPRVIPSWATSFR